jgi:hypothetical protein
VAQNISLKRNSTAAIMLIKEARVTWKGAPSHPIARHKVRQQDALRKTSAQGFTLGRCSEG